ncbi:MAG TPA: FAD/NAD(P)-binding protein [Xanthomonadaceae bacterium]|nr:FAD/NAD(P)-binding protein [Xanthomonadaceae bacterium]
MQRIAVIGGGAAGAAVVAEFLRRAGDLELFWFVGQHRPGRGVAYATSNGRHLLNVPAANMGLLADDVGGLVRYLRENNLPGSPSDFLPRAVLGDYIEATLAKLIAQCPPDVRVRTHTSEVVSLVPSHGGYLLQTDDDETVHVDGAVLAVGALPPVPIAEVDADALAGGKYLPDPWQRRQIVHVPNRVVVLGSGLTAIDVIITAATHWPNARIIALSRHGRLPCVHRIAANVPYPHARDLIERLRAEPSIRKWFRAVREAANDRGIEWRGVIDSLRPVTTELWRSLDVAQRRRFLRHARWAWEAVRHRLPLASADIIGQLQEEGRLTVLAGRIRKVEGRSPLSLTYRRRNDGATRTLTADLAIQATGLHTAVKRTAHPLLRQMFRDGLVCVDAQGQGIEADVDGRVVRADGTIAAGLRAIGPLMRGVLWECTALPEIRMMAARLARELPGELRQGRAFSRSVGAGRPG